MIKIIQLRKIVFAPLLSECVDARLVREDALDIVLLGLQVVSWFHILEFGPELMCTRVQIGFSGPPSVTVPWICMAFTQSLVSYGKV